MTGANKVSVFTGNLDIWCWVYGTPTAVGLLMLVFGSGSLPGFGALLISSVIGSFVVISTIEKIANAAEKQP